MARYQKLTVRTHIEIDGKSELWCEVSEDGQVNRYLSEEVTYPLEKKMLENVGTNMSRYISAHPESALWGATNWKGDKASGQIRHAIKK